MNNSDLKRLMKIEDRIARIAIEELGLKCYPIEFDIVPPQKMLEIMAYHIPTNISNWKFGRDYEKWRTIYDHGARGLPYEVVINSNPAKAYLMNNNKFGVHCLVMAHVYGHTAFFSTNKYFINSRQDIVNILFEASRRFLEYERRFGVDEVEKIEDAAHALQWHSSPFESRETEDERRKKVFIQKRRELHSTGGQFGELSGNNKHEINEDIELFNQRLWRKLKLKTPVEPTEDILRYLIDNSSVLEDWQKDILEVVRMEGQYFWPMVKTKFMNEGFATVIHEKIMTRLFEEDMLTASEHADYNYSNSLVKAENPFDLNPYLFGSSIWRNIESRWNKGCYGDEWDRCTDAKIKENWDTKEMKGWEKCLEVVELYTDWFFMQNFLTSELIRDMKVYVFEEKDAGQSIDYVITKDKADEIRRKLVNAFAQQMVPKIEVTNGNYNNSGQLTLTHKWDGIILDEGYARETMKHIAHLWGRKVYLHTKNPDGVELVWSMESDIDEEVETEKDKESDFVKAWLKSKSILTPLEQPYLCPF